MENEKIAAFMLAFVAFTAVACHSAEAHEVSGLVISPENPLSLEGITEDIVIAANCSAGPSSDMEARIQGPVIPPHVALSWNGSMFLGVLDGDSLAEPGAYSVNITCRDGSSQSFAEGAFTVSIVTGMITGVSPETAYAGEGIDMYFLVEKDGMPVSGLGVEDFEVRLGGQNKQIKLMYFTEDKGYKLRLEDPPGSKGIYEMEVTAIYRGREITNATQLEVIETAEAELIAVDKDNDDVVVKLRMTDHGSEVGLEEEHIALSVGSVDLDIEEISHSSGYTTARAQLPSLGPGRYGFSVEVEYEGYSKTFEDEIVFPVPVSGEISHDGKGIPLELQFRDENDVITTFTTDSSGRYSGTIPPGTYDITLKNDDSDLTLEGVEIEDEFNDPIRYYYEESGVDGMYSAGLYAYETALSFTSSRIIMRYNGRKVEVPESDLKVYRCDDWGGDECFSGWEEIDSDIDAVRDKAEISDDEITAYVIGNRKGITLQAGTDKQEYSLYETIVLEGIASIEDGTGLEGAEVKASIKGTPVSKKVSTGSGGAFLVEMDAPEKEGDFELEITVSKSPLAPLTIKRSFSVSKSRELSITIPGGVKMQAGGEKAVEFTLKNTGQAVLEDISLELEDLPAGITAVFSSETIGLMEPQEEATISINFTASADSGGTYPVVLHTHSEEDGVSAEKTFVLTSQTATDTTASSAGEGAVQEESQLTDFSLMGAAIYEAGQSYGYILILLVAGVLLALLMRKKRLSRIGERVWVKNMLSSVNQEIERSEMNKSRKTNRYKSFERVNSWSRS